MRKEIVNYLEELKAISLKKEDQYNFLSLEKYSCTLNNGKIIKREKLLKNKKDGSAAIIYPMTEDKKIILAIEPRVFTKRTVDIGLPAGYIESNEEPMDAAKRELLEETGYSSDNLIFLGSYYQDQGCSAALNHYFLALNCKKIKNQNLDEGEFIKYILVDENELKELVDNQYITGLNSVFTIEKAKQYIMKRN